MKTTGLILIWFTMTVILVFWHAGIEDMHSFLTTYVLLAIYLVWIAGRYVKRRNSEKNAL